MKKLVAFLLGTALLLSLCGCVDGGTGNDLFDGVVLRTSTLQFSWYTEKENIRSSVEDDADANMILAELSSVSATPVENWTPKKAGYPIYSIWTYKNNGEFLAFTWSNGFLIAQDGSVYKFSYDFSRLRDYDSELTERLSTPGFVPCLRYLALHEGQWYSKFLIPAEHGAVPEGVSMEILPVENGVGVVTAHITNTGSKIWDYGESFSLDVLVNGQWYHVPPLPDKSYAVISIAYSLHPGASVEKTYNLDMYGDLPSGTYRLVVEGLTAEFSL